MAGELETRAAAGSSPEDEAVARDLETALDGALRDLSDRDRETLLAYAQGEHTEVRGPTFRKRVERALGRLRAVWREKHGTR